MSAFCSICSGKTNCGIGAGSITAIGVCNLTVDRVYNSLEKKHGKFFPEGRLPLPILAAFLIGPVLLLYGWSTQAEWHIAFLLASVVLLGFCVVFGIVPMMTYVTDAFGLYSASALTAVLIARCLAGTFLPLVVAPIVDEVGYGWAFTIMAAACLVLAPVPVIVFRYGATWRQKSWYTRDEE